MNLLEALLVVSVVAICVDVALVAIVGRYFWKKTIRVEYSKKPKKGWNQEGLEPRRAGTKKGWDNVQNPNLQNVVEVHTLPPNDLVTHEWEDCACSPKTVPVPRPDGSMGWQVVHNALDGRP